MGLVGPDPILATMAARHVVATTIDGIPFRGHLFESNARGFPVLERAGFEIKIERLAIVTLWLNVRCRLEGLDWLGLHFQPFLVGDGFLFMKLHERAFLI